MVLRRKGKRSTAGMKLDDQYTLGVSRQLQAAIGRKVVIFSLHSILLSCFALE
jgi:hypothetical protein